MESIIHIGDCREHMANKIPAGSVHCVCSSPPYWGLRDYGIPGSEWADGWFGVYGLEPTVEQYVTHTLELFEGIGRVLCDDGVVFWNLGDSYATGAGKSRNPGSRAEPRSGYEGKHGYVNGYPVSQPNRMPQSIRSGNKLLIPYRVAIALQDAGWIVRQDNIWHKNSPMPESVSGWRWLRCRRKLTAGLVSRHGNECGGSGRIPHGNDIRESDGAKWKTCPGCSKCESTDGYILRRGAWRTTTAHEVVLMITKSDQYFCDGNAAAEPVTGNAHSRGTGINPKAAEKQIGQTRQNSSFSGAVSRLVETRNPRSVWSMSSEPYKGAHFATYPSELPFRCIKAATSAAGCCPHCGSQWAPVVLSERVATRPGNDTKTTGREGFEIGNRDPHRHVQVSRIEGYRPSCSCPAHEPVPATVYDPFTGSGTTLQVAYHMGRNAIGSEIGEQYLPLIQQRIQQVPKCLEVKTKKKRRKQIKQQISLF